MREPMVETSAQIDREGSENILRLQGHLGRSRAGALWEELQEALGKTEADRVVFDFSEVSGIDSAGLALLRLVERCCQRRGIETQNRNIPDQVRAYLEYARERSEGQTEKPEEEEPGFVTRAGLWGLEWLTAGRQVAEFAGNFVKAVLGTLRHPRRLRVREILYHLQMAGPDALPFIIWLSLLMGYIMGIQATRTLSTFGAAIRIADVVTIGTVKEMGPLLTAVILAGRSGAAFTAEIGTMKTKEEIDALEVMGISSMDFLVLPRVFALLIVGPLLTLIANAAGVIGGLIVGVTIMELSIQNYLTEVGSVLTAVLIYEGIIKGAGFALLIGMNGCFHGLRTGGAAEDVGVKTTTAVVSGIFLIVLADALFSGIFHIYAFG